MASVLSVAPIAGGIAAPAGVRVAGVACGIKTDALDLALVVADREASAAGVFTTNLAKAAPVIVTRDHLRMSGGRARAIVVNSGCANACTGEPGLADARTIAAAAARAVSCPVEQVLVASTGVIGVRLDASKVCAGVARAAGSLSVEGHDLAARAIMTTDRAPKAFAVAVESAVGAYRVGGMAKGAGMIEPRMATMLGFLTTDAVVAPPLLQRALALAVDDTFNAITVDGDTSTNDCVLALATGASGSAVSDGELDAFAGALRAVARELAVAVVRGAEGATKLITVRVSGAASSSDARQVARTISNSPLVKTAVHGADPNWGRIVAAAGRAGVWFDVDRTSVWVGGVPMFQAGAPHDENAPRAAAHLRGDEVDVHVDLGSGGQHDATIWTCDLSAEYVRINADYRT